MLVSVYVLEEKHLHWRKSKFPSNIQLGSLPKSFRVDDVNQKVIHLVFVFVKFNFSYKSTSLWRHLKKRVWASFEIRDAGEFISQTFSGVELSFLKFQGG